MEFRELSHDKTYICNSELKELIAAMIEHLICARHYLYALFLTHHFIGQKIESESLANVLKIITLLSGRTKIQT